MALSLHPGDTAKCLSKRCFPAPSCAGQQASGRRRGLRQHLCRSCLSTDVIILAQGDRTKLSENEVTGSLPALFEIISGK